MVGLITVLLSLFVYELNVLYVNVVCDLQKMIKDF